jgi:hypothetical protein
MKEAKDAMDEDADLLRASLGKPARAKPAAASGGDPTGEAEAEAGTDEMVRRKRARQALESKRGERRGSGGDGWLQG